MGQAQGGLSPYALGDWTHQEGRRARNPGTSSPLKSGFSRESWTLHQGWILLSDVHHWSNSRCLSPGHAQES